MTEPPFIAVVPPVSVVTEAAVTAALKVVVPVVLTVKAPSAPLVPPPTAPVKVTLPDPADTVSGLAAEAALSTVDENKTAPLPEVLLSVTAEPVIVTAPV